MHLIRLHCTTGWLDSDQYNNIVTCTNLYQQKIVHSWLSNNNKKSDRSYTKKLKQIVSDQRKVRDDGRRRTSICTNYVDKVNEGRLIINSAFPISNAIIMHKVVMVNLGWTQ